MSTMISDKSAADNIALNVRRLLEQRQLNQADLSRLTGDPEYAISRIVRGLHRMNVAIVARIAEAFDVSIDRLVSAPPEKVQKILRETVHAH